MFGKTVKYGITQLYIFDNVAFGPKLLTGSLKKMKRLLTNMSEKPFDYCSQVQKDWVLDGLPKQNIIYLDPPIKLPDSDNVHLIARVTYSHDTKGNDQNGISWLSKIILFLVAWSVIGIVAMGLIFHRLDQQKLQEPHCRIYYQSGTPHSITVDTSTYKLQSDGSMDKYTMAFLNPYHREIIDSGRCERSDR